ncbi:MAG TPA: hypothetical protein VHM02_13705, partial [Thermoanaerobaculia bacterium]|nr:hypothetical protein [Thermoanaerobaculia bacterium]
MMIRKVFFLTLATLGAAVAAQAQLEGLVSARDRLGASVASGEAVGGEVTRNLSYDDGEPDNGVQANFPSAIEFAMRFDVGEPGTLEQLQICFQRLFSSDSASGTFDVGIYRVSGGAPGPLLHAFVASVSGFPVTILDGQFRAFGLPSPVAVPSSFFVGVEMDSLTSDLYLCVDEDGARRPVFASIAGFTALARKTLSIKDAYDAAELQKFHANLRF